LTKLIGKGAMPSSNVSVINWGISEVFMIFAKGVLDAWKTYTADHFEVRFGGTSMDELP
jgi:hypothetical protein